MKTEDKIAEYQDALASVRYMQRELAQAKAKARKAFDALTIELGYEKADSIKTGLYYEEDRSERIARAR